MTELKDIQALFQESVMGSDTKFLTQIEAGGRITPEKRLYIYQHAYRARLKEVLAEDYPVMHSMLGDQMFFELCQQYIDAFPSTHPSLRYFGAHLEEFVRQAPLYCNQKIIEEMARFEWLFHDVFDAKDRDYVTLEDVGALDPSVWTTLRFSFCSSLKVSAYDWNVAAVWNSVQAEDDQPTLPIKMPETRNVIQWRHDLKSYFRTLDSDEAEVLSQAMKKKSFPELCETLSLTIGDKAPVRAAEILKTWVVEGLIAELHTLDIDI